MDNSKIGVITFHKANNYGSVLQAYALKATLDELGFDACVIDYQSKGQQELYAFPRPNDSFKNVVKNLLNLPYRRQLYERERRMNQFREEHLNLTPSFSSIELLGTLEDEFDFFIAGSDQIWKPGIPDFTDAYLLSFVSSKQKCISYAASLAVPKLQSENFDLFRKHLSGFRAISIREQDCQKELSQLTGQSVSVVPDPVLLISDSGWAHVAALEPFGNTRYVLGYFLANRPDMQQFATKYAKKNMLDYFSINYTNRGVFTTGKKEYGLGPAGFVSAIKNADLVVTNSFHALAFSIIFEKRVKLGFDNSSHNNANSRITTVLEKVYPSVKFEFDQIIDFAQYHDVSRLAEYSEEGKSFLKRSLGLE